MRFIRSVVPSVRPQLVCLLLSAALGLLAAPVLCAAGRAEFQPKDVCPQSQEEEYAPTVVNMLKAKQAGDLEKAGRMQALLKEKAKKFWRPRAGDEIVAESCYPLPPQRDNAYHKPYLWDNDQHVFEGPVSGGISIDYDTDGNAYAVACTSWNGVANACIKVVKSTDGGDNWPGFVSFSSMSGSYSYPVLLTASTNNKVYLLYLHSSQNGIIQMKRYTQSGVLDGTYDVKVDTDTITYFSACVDFENGNHLMVAYQKEEMGDPTPDLYTITSADYGETWGNEEEVIWFGTHPDIAYGRNGYVYLVWTYPEAEGYEIMFYRSTDYCSPGSWVNPAGLTDDLYFNDYPKVAVLNSLPDSTPYVWVAYNRENPAGTNIDLAYAYSWNGGKDWSTNRILDSSAAYHEMGCDLWTKRSADAHYVHVCYFRGRYVHPFPRGAIFYASTNAQHPPNWGFPNQKSDFWPTQYQDGRKVCQGTFAQGDCAFIYVGKDPWDDPFGDDFHDVWFDNSAWPVDVEEEMTEEEAPAEFSLSSNYPNPFNPSTRIQYTVHSKQTPLHTTLKIYNIKGQLVRTLVDEPKGPGTYRVIWDGKSDDGKAVASGVYLYQLRVGDFGQARKMVLIK